MDDFEEIYVRLRHFFRRIQIGCGDAAMPMFDYFHLVGICDFGTQEQHEIDIPLENIRTGFSEYMSGNGLFTLTYPETDARFFYLRVGDK